jgi:hypothetical protein
LASHSWKSGANRGEKKESFFIRKADNVVTAASIREK